MSAAALKVTTEARPSSRLAVTVTVPGERCKTSYEDAITSLSRSINLPGFRKGKVPRTVLVQQLGGVRIKATALEKLIDNAWRDAIQQESLEPISQPDLSSGFDGLLESFEPGKELTFTLEADVAPTPKLKTTKGLKAEFETVAYDASRVDAMLEDSRKQMATVVPVEGRAAKNGDIAVLGFKGTYSDDGSEIEGGSADSMDVDLENGRMIPGFIEGVIGMKVGETKTVDCQFPDDYPKEDARGRKAAFEIELKDLKTRELPELDDEFAKQASEQETLADLRKDLEQRLKDDAERRQTSNRRDALVAALVEQLEVEGVSVELIDLISLKPFDMETISRSIRKTNKVIVVEECMKTGGIGAELIALITEQCFDDLDARPVRLSSQDIPTPYNGSLENLTIIQPHQIVEAAQALVNKGI